jgi:NAD+ diphosphatase
MSWLCTWALLLLLSVATSLSVPRATSPAVQGIMTSAASAARHKPAFFTTDLHRSGRDALLEPGALEAALARPESVRILPVHRGKNGILGAGDDRQQLYFMPVQETQDMLQEQGDDAVLIHLGSTEEHTYFALHIPPDLDYTPSSADATMVQLRSVAENLRDDADAGLLGLARSLADFHASNRFCANCGAKTASYKLGSGRRCSSDGCSARVVYPRIDVAMIAVVLSSDGESCLLGRKSVWPPGRYSCLAGFTEMCEGLEQTVVREVWEEVGVTVDAATLQFESSQPWPFPRQLMAGFTVRALKAPAGAALPPIQVDTNELEAAQWFSRETIAAALTCDGAGGELHFPSRASLARKLLQDWALA